MTPGPARSPLLPPGYWEGSGIGFRLGEWPTPGDVRTDGDQLLWTTPTWDRATASAANGTLLADFLGLAEADAEQIADFARRWGVLGLCRHGLPRGHNLESAELLDSGRPTRAPCPPVQAATGPGIHEWSEPIQAWRDLSSQAATMLKLAHGLHGGGARVGSHSDWERLPRYRTQLIHRPSAETGPRKVSEGTSFRRNWKPEPGPVPATIPAAREWLGVVIDEWLRWGDLRIVVDWGRTATLKIRSVSLFGAVALEVARAVARAEDLTTCSGCGIAYAPSRTPKPDQNNYCPECRGKGVPQRDAQRRQRQGTAKPRKAKSE